MSMLSSYTLLSRALPLPGKFSRGAAAQPHKQPTAPSLVAVVPRVPLFKQSRAPLLVCRAQKNTYNIQPGALVHPTPASGSDNWSIWEDKGHINLKFNVGDSTSKEKLEVTMEDQVLLVIRYTGDPNDDSPASKLDVRLLMPLGYDGTKEKVKAMMIPGGWLQISIARPKHEPYKIQIS